MPLTHFDNNYRIKRNAIYEDQMRYLWQDLKLFQTYAQILMISAMIGYINHRKLKIEKAASDGVLMQFFSERNYDFMDFIAYADTKNQAVLSTNEKYEIFEQYANGGFPILLDKLDIDFVDKSRNDRNVLLKRYFSLLITNGFCD